MDVSPEKYRTFKTTIQATNMYGFSWNFSDQLVVVRNKGKGMWESWKLAYVWVCVWFSGI